MKFVIVDDEEINLVITKKLLQHILGAVDILTFTDGGEALTYFSNNFDYNVWPQVNLFLDLNMPIVSGWDFLDFFRELKDEIKSRVNIYILTSSIDPIDKRRALTNSNVIACFSKPLTPGLIREYFGENRSIALLR